MPHGTKVLIVEDSRVQARIMSEHIRGVTPYETLVTATLAETAQVMEQSRDDIFVAVLDLNLPDDTGGEIVALANQYAVPAVVMTSSFDEEVRKKLLEQNVVDYFLKSMSEVANMENLIERLHKNLSVTVLVADDSKLSRRQMTTLLRNQNYQVMEAEDGAAALDILRDTPEVRLLITDYHMPHMDGFELITELRKTRPKDRLAIIGVSAEGGEQTARFIKNGANDFLTKPIGMEEFYCRVNQQMDMLDILQDYKALCEKKGS